MAEENEIQQANSETRVRVNIGQTAKGAVQINISTETPTVDQSIELMKDAVIKLIAMVKEQGLKLASE